MKVVIDGFGGAIPKAIPLMLPFNRAQLAEACRFDYGYLRPLNNNKEWAINLVKTGEIKALYRYKAIAGDPLSGYPFHWTARTQVATGFIRGDVKRALAFTQEGDFPRITDATLATTGGTDYPVNSYRLGVPVPDSSPKAELFGATSIYTNNGIKYEEDSFFNSVFSENEIVKLETHVRESLGFDFDILILRNVTTKLLSVYKFDRASPQALTKVDLPKEGTWVDVCILPTSEFILVGDGTDGYGAVIVDPALLSKTLKATPLRKWTSIACRGSNVVAVTDDMNSNPAMRSTDGGLSWSILTGMPIRAWCSITANPYGNTGGDVFFTISGGTETERIGRSLDGGSSWALQTLPAKSTGTLFKRIKSAEATSYYGGAWNYYLTNYYAFGNGGEDNIILTVNTGTNWNAISETFPAGHQALSSLNLIKSLDIKDVIYGRESSEMLSMNFTSPLEILAVQGGTKTKICRREFDIIDGFNYSIAGELSNVYGNCFMRKNGSIIERDDFSLRSFSGRKIGVDSDSIDRAYLIGYESYWTTQRFEGVPAQDEQGNIKFSSKITVIPNQAIKISGLPAIGDIPSLPWKVTHVAIYRNLGSQWRFVGRVDAGVTTFIDDVSDDELGGELVSGDYYPPPADMHHIGTLNNGIAFGATDNEVAFSYPYLVHAWGPNNRIPFDSTVLAAISLGALLYVFTKDNPFIVTGQDPQAMYAEEIPIGHGCISADSVCSVGSGVVYASAIGLHLLRPGQPTVNLIEELMTKQQWSEFAPPSMLCGFHEGWLLVFWNSGAAKGCLVFRLDSPKSGVVHLPDFDATAVFSDPALGAMTYVTPFDGVANKAFIFQGDNNANTPYRWRSGMIKPPRATAYTAARVWSKDYGKPLTFRLFNEEGVLLHTHSVTSERAFRLPGGQRSMAMFVELEGTQEIMRIEIASSMGELST